MNNDTIILAACVLGAAVLGVIAASKAQRLGLHPLAAPALTAAAGMALKRLA